MKTRSTSLFLLAVFAAGVAFAYHLSVPSRKPVQANSPAKTFPN